MRKSARFVLVFVALTVAPAGASAGGGTAKALRRAIEAWDRACPRMLAPALCVEESARPARHHCTEAPVRYRVRRKKSAGRSAARRMERILGKQPPGPDALVVMARLRLADRIIESLAEVKLPRNLDFRPEASRRVRNRSNRRFELFLTTAEERSRGAIKALESLGQHPGAPDVSIAWRRGYVAEMFAELLRGVEIPKYVRTGKFAADTKKAFCATLWEKSMPLERLAQKAYEHCKRTAREHGEKVDLRCEKGPAYGRLSPARLRLRLSVVDRQLRDCGKNHALAQAALKVSVNDGVASVAATKGTPKELVTCLAGVIRRVAMPRGADADTEYVVAFQRPTPQSRDDSAFIGQ